MARQQKLRRSLRVILAALLVCLVVGTPVGERQPHTQEVSQRPNVLFILTDDQIVEDLAGMSNVQRLLVNQGTTFSHAFATTALCCPSRVSFMRGQYAHNHGVLSNKSRHGAYPKVMELGLENSTVATWLHDAGYSTFYAGKFLNGYEDTHVPPGWDEWYAFARPPTRAAPQDYYTVNENGTLKTYTQEEKHDTYYLRDKAEAFIRNHAQEGSAPWFAWVSTHAPHGPHTIAPEFLNSYDSAAMPQPPSYNEADVSDKPAWVQARPRLDDDCSTDKSKLDCHEQVVEWWRARQESLLSVDVMVNDLVSALDDTNQLDRTYIVFASDNGYLLYRHRITGKSAPYEESQGVPFVVRGPGVQQGVAKTGLVANIDLAPTIAEWASVQAPEYVDGRSLVPLLDGSSASWRRYLLFEQFYVHPYRGIRTNGGKTYVEHKSGEKEKEYYDLAKDPWQLDSAHAAPENAERLSKLSAALSELKRCSGAGCRAVDGGP